MSFSSSPLENFAFPQVPKLWKEREKESLAVKIRVISVSTVLKYVRKHMFRVAIAISSFAKTDINVLQKAM